MPGGAALRVHHPAWKARTPRDLGAGWDFEDVRDHYLQCFYRVDPVALRTDDPARYLALSRALSAEVMMAAFGEWRRPASSCRGALVWFLRDLWAGAGWGLLDDQGLPKAAFHGLKRALAPVALFISDEGTNGLDLHFVNEPARPFSGEIGVALYRDDGLHMRESTQHHVVPAHGALTLPLAHWFDEFVDLSRAYRFGPAEHAVVVATLRDDRGTQIAQAFQFPEGLPARVERSVGLRASAGALADGSVEVQLKSEGFAQSLHFDVPGFVAEDEYFHLAPGGERRVRLRPVTLGARFAGSVCALNDRSIVSLALA
jgi:beta-mannosidase